jgi:hypothetical protein
VRAGYGAADVAARERVVRGSAGIQAPISFSPFSN